MEGLHDTGDFSAKSRARELNDAAGLLPVMLYRDGNRVEYESSDGVVHGGHLHHKTLIIDGTRVLAGSYNWSMSARDRNLEILFDLAHAGPRFQAEFERIRGRAELVPRSAVNQARVARFSLERQVGTTGAVSAMLCSSDAPGAGLIRFAGRGPYFRGEYLAAKAGAEPCRLWKKFAGPSAGPRGLPPFSIAGEASTRSKFGAVRGPGGVYIALDAKPEQRPCEDATRCESIVIHRAWKKEGLLLLDGEREFHSVRFLSAYGFGPPLALGPAGANLYGFDPDQLPGGDLALFLKDAHGREWAGCLRSGTVFSGPARDVLQSLARARNEPIHCAQLE